MITVSRSHVSLCDRMGLGLGVRFSVDLPPARLAEVMSWMGAEVTGRPYDGDPLGNFIVACGRLRFLIVLDTPYQGHQTDQVIYLEES